MRLRSSSAPENGAPLLRAVESRGPAPPRRAWSRGLYLVALGALVVAAAYSAATAALFLEAPGVVDLGETSVQLERVGRAERLLVAPGARVARGAPVVEVTVLDEEAAAQRSHEEARRLRAELEGEADRAATRARQQASADRSEAARLRDDGLRASAEAAELAELAAGLRRQLAELDREAEAQASLEAQAIASRSSGLDLRLRRHDVRARLDGATRRQALLSETAAQLLAAAADLDARAGEAEADALADSRLAALRARLAEVQAEGDWHASLARRLLRAPADGTVSWVDARPGEVVQAGEPILRLVPEGAALVVAWPGAGLEAFAAGATVVVRGPSLEALGTVERVLEAERSKPAALLRPYEREAVGPAVLVRVEEALAGQLRAGSVVEVSRPRFAALARWLHRPRPEPAHLAAR